MEPTAAEAAAQATAMMLDPSDCGPAFIGLCQDTQEIAYEYPVEFFEPKIHSIPRPRADKKYIEQAIKHIKSSKKQFHLNLKARGAICRQQGQNLGHMYLYDFLFREYHLPLIPVQDQNN